MKSKIGTVIVLILMAAGLTFVITWNAAGSYFRGAMREYEQEFAQAEKYLQVKSYIDAYFVGDYDKKVMDDYVAEAMVASLGDKWSYYLAAEDYAGYVERINNSYVGIGVTISAYYEDDNNETLFGYEIVAVTGSGPADIAGLLPQDIIVQVEGLPSSQMTLEEIKALVRGEEGTQVTLTVLRGSENLDIGVLRGSVDVAAVEYELLPDGVGLISIYNFDANVAEKAIAAVDDLIDKGAAGIVFDVRNNPGGLLDELVDLLDYLLPEGDLFVSRNKSYQIMENGKALGETVLKSDASCVKIPMAVLVNSNSYSAAEFFAACLQEYNWAAIVGEATTGKGYSQRSLVLPDGSALVLSTNEYFTPSRISLAQTGIEPDYPVEIGEEEFFGVYYQTIELSQDSQLQKAVSVVLQQAHRLENAS